MEKQITFELFNCDGVKKALAQTKTLNKGSKMWVSECRINNRRQGTKQTRFTQQETGVALTKIPISEAPLTASCWCNNPVDLVT